MTGDCAEGIFRSNLVFRAIKAPTLIRKRELVNHLNSSGFCWDNNFDDIASGLHHPPGDWQDGLDTFCTLNKSLELYSMIQAGGHHVDYQSFDLRGNIKSCVVSVNQITWFIQKPLLGWTPYQNPMPNLHVVHTCYLCAPGFFLGLMHPNCASWNSCSTCKVISCALWRVREYSS